MFSSTVMVSFLASVSGSGFGLGESVMGSERFVGNRLSRPRLVTLDGAA